MRVQINVIKGDLKKMASHFIDLDSPVLADSLAVIDNLNFADYIENGWAKETVSSWSNQETVYEVTDFGKMLIKKFRL